MFQSLTYTNFFLCRYNHESLRKGLKVTAIMISILVVSSALAMVGASFTHGQPIGKEKLPPTNTKVNYFSMPYHINKKHSSAESDTVQLSGSGLMEQFTFIESGLPSGTLWSVAIANQTISSRNQSMSLNLESGLYSYRENNAVNFFSPQSSGTINTASRSLLIQFYGIFNVTKSLNLTSGSLSSALPSLNNSAALSYGVYDKWSSSILVADYSSGKIVEVNATSLAIEKAVNLGYAPKDIAVGNLGTVYVLSSSYITELNSSLIPVRFIKLDTTDARSIAYNPSSGLIFVGTYSNGTLIFNSSSMQQTGSLPYADVQSTQGIFVLPDSVNTYIASYSNDTLIELAGTNVVRYYTIPASPISILEIPHSTMIISTFPSPQTGFSLFRLNLSSGNVTGIINATIEVALAYDPQIDTVLAGSVCASPEVLVMNSRYSGLAENISTVMQPYFMIYDPEIDAVVSGGIFSNGLEILSLSDLPVTLTFSETGLPNGVTWSVKADNYTISSDSSHLNFTVIPGNISYVVKAPQNFTAQTQGYAVVGSQNYSVKIEFYPLYDVKFIESGLPSGSEWNVNFTGFNLSSDSHSLVFKATSGLHSYVIYGSGMYSSSFPKGYINVSGNETINVEFTGNPSRVQFRSSGLPASQPWYVKVDGLILASSGNYLNTSAAPGSYNYTILSIPGYKAYPSTGSFLSSSSVPINITWKPVLYNVTITETGLPSGYTWAINVSGSVYWNNGNTTVLQLPNGSFQMHAFVKGAVYSALPVHFSINGSEIAVSVIFTAVLYDIAIHEEGLPQGYSWKISLSNGMVAAAAAGIPISLSLMNGTYQASLQDSSTSYRPIYEQINLTVDGASYNYTVTFVPVVFKIELEILNLPQNTSWSLFIGTASYTGISGPQFVTYLQNGTYGIKVVPSNHDYHSFSGSVNVSGAGKTIKVILSPVLFVVNFTERGLPPGSEWYIAGQNGSNLITSGSVQSALFMNGSYSLRYISFSPEFKGGTVSFVVDGHSLNLSLHFTLVQYEVVFSVAGQYRPESWYLSIDGGKYVEYNSLSAALFLPNGTYTFLASQGNTSWGEATGNFTVSGSALSVTIIFKPVEYRVNFTLDDASHIASWYLNISGMKYLASGKSYSVYLQNGTYSFSISGIPGFISYTSNFSVDGKNMDISVHLASDSHLVIFKTDLARGENWYLNMSNGENFTIDTPVFHVALANGNYSFTIYSSGYRLYAGNLTLKDTNIVLHIDLIPVKLQVIFRETGLPSGTIWGININGSTFRSSARTIQVELPAGHYSLNVSAIPGYMAQAPGNFNLNHAHMHIHIHFRKVHEQFYPVTISSFAPPGVLISVSINGTAILHPIFQLPDGNYTVDVSIWQKGSPCTAEFNFSVNGTGVSILIIIAPPAVATFIVYNLPPGPLLPGPENMPANIPPSQPLPPPPPPPLPGLNPGFHPVEQFFTRI